MTNSVLAVRCRRGLNSKPGNKDQVQQNIQGYPAIMMTICARS